MDAALLRAVKQRIKRHEMPARIRKELLEKGYRDRDITQAFKKLMVEHLSESEERARHNARLVAVHEVIDRIGYGAAAPQFVNILFSQLPGANLFLLGLFNGLRTIISGLLTSVTQEFARRHRVTKRVISSSGILFGFSFLLMAVALWLDSPWAFGVGMLFSGIGVIAYGDLYTKFLQHALRREKRGGFLLWLGEAGVLITMVAMLFSGWLIDHFPATAAPVTLFGMTFRPLGYLLSFEITAIAFILSGYLLSFITEPRATSTATFFPFMKRHLRLLVNRARELMRNPYVRLLLFATAITGLLEILGQSYYGVYIYSLFKDEFFGGFLNVAIIYSFAIIASFAGPWLTRRVHRIWGLTPMLVFGTMLMAILPFVLVVNPDPAAVTVALMVGVIGNAIVGFGQGLLARKLLREEERRHYFMSLGALVALPYLFLVPLGSWFAQTLGLQSLFMLIGFGLALVVTPLYFLLVILSNKQRL